MARVGGGQEKGMRAMFSKHHRKSSRASERFLDRSKTAGVDNTSVVWQGWSTSPTASRRRDAVGIAVGFVKRVASTRREG